MSLWEKWEKEKLEKAGMKVEHHSDVTIRDARPKTNFRKQAGIVFGVLAVCIVLFYIAVTFDVLSTGRHWSQTYIVRFFADRNAQRGAVQQESE